MTKNYWLKPIGIPEKWIEPTDFSDFREQIHFPNHAGSVKIGDWIFLHAVGHQKLVGLFQVDTLIDEFTPEEKNEVGYNWRITFPFYLYANNLFKVFSNDWHTHSINTNLLDDEFSKLSKGRVTPTNDTINAIQHGKSHIRLTEEFAQFLLDVMKSSKMTI